jgi:hypothetical protein
MKMLRFFGLWFLILAGFAVVFAAIMLGYWLDARFGAPVAAGYGLLIVAGIFAALSVDW